MVEELKVAGIGEDQIDTLSFTSASSCLIEFKENCQAEKALNIKIDQISEGGQISKLIFTNQNNFVLLHGTSEKELQETSKFQSNETSGTLVELGILQF